MAQLFNHNLSFTTMSYSYENECKYSGVSDDGKITDIGTNLHAPSSRNSQIPEVRHAMTLRRGLLAYFDYMAGEKIKEMKLSNCNQGKFTYS